MSSSPGAPSNAAAPSAPARLAEVLDAAIAQLRSDLTLSLEIEFLTPLTALRAENAQLREQLYAAAALPLGATASASGSQCAAQSALNPVAGAESGCEVQADADTEVAATEQAEAASDECSQDLSQCRSENPPPILLPSSCQMEVDQSKEEDPAEATAIQEQDPEVKPPAAAVSVRARVITPAEPAEDPPKRDASGTPCQKKIGLLYTHDACKGRGGLMAPQTAQSKKLSVRSTMSRESCGSALSLLAGHRSTKLLHGGVTHPKDSVDANQPRSLESNPPSSLGSLVSSVPPHVFSAVLPNKTNSKETLESDSDESAVEDLENNHSISFGHGSPPGPMMKYHQKTKEKLQAQFSNSRLDGGFSDCMAGSASYNVREMSVTGTGMMHMHPTWADICEIADAAEASRITMGAGRDAAPTKSHLSTTARAHDSRYVTDDDSDTPSENSLRQGNRCAAIQQRCMVQPNSLRRLFWEFLGMALILWDVVWIPFLLFDPPDSTYAETCGWLARIFWTCDIPFSFVTGYITQEGILEMRRKWVSRRYMRTRLPFDLSLVCADWIECMVRNLASFLSTARVGKVLRTFRVLRMIRLARLLKLPGIMDMFTERIFSEKVVLLMSIVKSTLCIIITAHVFACFWYKLGLMRSNSWLTEYQYTDKMLGVKYAVSLHWSMARFIGEPPVMSTNLTEHCYAIFSLILSFVMSAAFVSSITTSMTRLQIIGVEDQSNFTMLRRFLRIQAVSTKLAMRITKNARFAVKQQKRHLVEDDVVLFQLLSEPLMIELHYEIYARVLRAHPAFDLYCMCNPQGMRKVCHTSVAILHVSKGDVLFNKGERVDHGQMLLIVNGKMKYDKDTLEKQEVEPGQWVCEMVLWASWVHCGNLRVDSECQVLALSSEKFQYVGARYFDDTDEDIHPAAYARWYVNKMLELTPDEMTDLDPGFGLSNEMKMAVVVLTTGPPGAQGGWANSGKIDMPESIGEGNEPNPQGRAKRVSKGSAARVSWASRTSDCSKSDGRVGQQY